MSPAAYDLVIVNGVVVSASDTVPLAIGVRDGKIASLQESFSAEELECAEIIDAE